jgi:hypothetical protein
MEVLGYGAECPVDRFATLVKVLIKAKCLIVIVEPAMKCFNVLTAP